MLALILYFFEKVFPRQASPKDAFTFRGKTLLWTPIEVHVGKREDTYYHPQRGMFALHACDHNAYKTGSFSKAIEVR